MNPIRWYTAAAFVLALLVSAQPSAGEFYNTRADIGNVVTGELVVTNSSTNQFRIVGQNGMFRAPAGMPIETLDGKPVQVELSRGGSVIQITETPIQIDPMQHRYDIVQGQLVMADPMARSFTIAGDPRVYVAPVGLPIESYAGRLVKLLLDEHGQVKKVELAADTAPGVPVSNSCSYNGEGYSDGGVLCQSGTQFRCESGTWRNLGTGCSPLAAVPAAGPCSLRGVAYPDGTMQCDHGRQFRCDRGQWRALGTACAYDTSTASRSPRSCMLAGATIANAGSICRDGTTYRCDNGEWMNTEIACR